MIRIPVRVTPRAGGNEVTGWRGGELEVRVSAAPDGGKANAAVCETVAKRLGIAKSRVTVVTGHTSRHKVLSAEVGEQELRAAFGDRDAPLF